jgi:2-polyprenyl-3-methyl-5-hydroxy-6-metoxy-1,4-benzoquinol methylase
MTSLSTQVAGIVPASANRNASPPQVLAKVAQDYPSVVRESQLKDVERIAYHIGLVQRYGKPGARVCDVGGGVGLFAPGCAALGYDTTLVDDFEDEINFSCDRNLFAPHQQHGVKVISRDVMAEGADFPQESFDVVTVFDSMEHWQRSPRRLRRLLQALKRTLAPAPAGVLIIGAPKRKNLPRRVLTLLRGGHPGTVREWYDSDLSCDEVHWPGVSDLRHICKDLDLNVLSVSGRNWLDRMSYPVLSRVTDPLLRMLPRACSDMYVVARRR